MSLLLRPGGGLWDTWALTRDRVKPMHRLVKHPCIAHKMARLRDELTDAKTFRELAAEVTVFVCYEALAELRLRSVAVTTPLAVADCQELDEDVIIIPILRAGLGMLEPVLQLVPQARVGFLGLFRDAETHEPHEYYNKLPPGAESAMNIIIDPMIATGGSTIATIDAVKRAGATRIQVVCLVTCPEGLEAVAQAHPDVTVFAAAIDDHLDDNKYIVPGLGDAGDRLFGTMH